MIVLGCVLVLVSGFVESAVIFGSPPTKTTLDVLAPVGLGVGFVLLGAGNYVLQRRRRLDPSHFTRSAV
jgi:hypothetical protein